jgi:cell shape-determining protein MreD
MISFGIAGTILSNLSKVIAVNKMLYQSIAIFLTGLAAAVLTSLVLSFRVNGAEFNFMFIIGSSIYSSIAGPFLFVPCQWLMRIKKSKQQR